MNKNSELAERLYEFEGKFKEVEIYKEREGYFNEKKVKEQEKEILLLKRQIEEINKEKSFHLLNQVRGLNAL